MESHDPMVWGAKYWFVMMSIAESYPKINPCNDIVTSANAFYESLKTLLPCDTCRAHYTKLLTSYPVINYLHSRQSLVNWVKMIQNSVETAQTAQTIRPAETIQSVKTVKTVKMVKSVKTVKQHNVPRSVTQKTVRGRFVQGVRGVTGIVTTKQCKTCR